MCTKSISYCFNYDYDTAAATTTTTTSRTTSESNSCLLPSHPPDPALLHSLAVMPLLPLKNPAAACAPPGLPPASEGTAQRAVTGAWCAFSRDVICSGSRGREGGEGRVVACRSLLGNSYKSLAGVAGFLTRGCNVASVGSERRQQCFADRKTCGVGCYSVKPVSLEVMGDAPSKQELEHTCQPATIVSSFREGKTSTCHMPLRA